jgi:hypothetical protein
MMTIAKSLIVFGKLVQHQLACEGDQQVKGSFAFETKQPD